MPRFSKTKIVATVGPACDGPVQLEALVAEGVDVFRLDMAHGDLQRQAMRLAAIRRASRELGQPVAVLVDLAGAPLSPEARENAIWASQGEVDFIGLSLVRGSEDVLELKHLLLERQSSAQVIARIEKAEAPDYLAAIIEAADGVMVARGDVGLETDISDWSAARKRIVAECNRRRKPVIVATQITESMQGPNMRGRAEASEVADAIRDGADACMLSGETAIGKHPREAVAMMHRIAVATEPLVHHAQGRVEAPAGAVSPITEATVRAASQLAEDLGAKLIVVATAGGATALALSKRRNSVATLGVSDSPATLRRMALYWGVIPMAGVPVSESGRLAALVIEWGRGGGLLGDGDRVVIVSGTGLLHSAQSQILVREVPLVFDRNRS